MSEEVTGRVVQIIGPVVDVEFPDQHLPAILNAVQIVDDGNMGEVPIDVTTEVALHLGENRARCLANKLFGDAAHPQSLQTCQSVGSDDDHSRPYVLCPCHALVRGMPD